MAYAAAWFTFLTLFAMTGIAILRMQKGEHWSGCIWAAGSLLPFFGQVAAFSELVPQEYRLLAGASLLAEFFFILVLTVDNGRRWYRKTS